MAINDRQRIIIRQLWKTGRQSRSELHDLTGIRLNSVGDLAGQLINMGLIRECTANRSRGGRPRVPLEIDPETRHVIGIAIRSECISAIRMNLLGDPIGQLWQTEIANPNESVSAAVKLLEDLQDDKTLIIAVSEPGFVDIKAHKMLHNSLGLDKKSNADSLEPIYNAAGNCPVVINNDMHGLASQWALTGSNITEKDVLIININDGELGASAIANDKPVIGCVASANELGHTRLTVKTPDCYCGHAGCLERICSSEFLQMLTGDKSLDLSRLAEQTDTPAQGALDKIIEYTSLGIANAVNFLKPSKVVFAGKLAEAKPFSDRLISQIKAQLLSELTGRVEISTWNRQAYNQAQTTGYLALMGLYCKGWLSNNINTQEK